MDLLILSADKSILKWKTLSDKLIYLRSILNTGKNADFTIGVEYKALKPLLNKEKRISHTWLEEITKPYLKNYDMVCFHFSEQQKKDWGIKNTLRGSNPDDDQNNFWVSSDEKTTRYGFNRFEQVVLHELSHEYFQRSDIPDTTHAYHEKHKNIAGLLSTFNWSLYKSLRQTQKKEINRLQGILAALQAIFKAKQETGTKPQVNELLPLVKRQADLLVKEMELLGLPIRITEGFRSDKRQNELYAQGRTTKGNIVTNAKAGESLHNYGVAVDIVFRKQGYEATNDQWLAMATVAERFGFEWGGKWNEFVDKPHLQLMKGYSLKDFQNKKVDYNKYN